MTCCMPAAPCAAHRSLPFAGACAECRYDPVGPWQRTGKVALGALLLLGSFLTIPVGVVAGSPFLTLVGIGLMIGGVVALASGARGGHRVNRYCNVHGRGVYRWYNPISWPIFHGGWRSHVVHTRRPVGFGRAPVGHHVAARPPAARPNFVRPNGRSAQAPTAVASRPAGDGGIGLGRAPVGHHVAARPPASRPGFVRPNGRPAQAPTTVTSRPAGDGGVGLGRMPVGRRP